MLSYRCTTTKKTVVLINGIFDYLEEFITENEEETNNVNVRFFLLMIASKLVGLKKLSLYYQAYIFA